MKNLLRLIAVLFLFIWQAPANAQSYCTTGLYTSGCTFGDDLDDVTIGSFSQTATGCSTGAYADYTSDTIAIAQTEQTAFSVTSNFSTQWYAIWIDANDDGDFDDAGEFLWNSTAASGASGTVTSGSFVIDTAISTGTHRLRVRAKYAGTAILSSQSCSSFTYGEVHDYTVNVLPPPACPTPYALSAAPTATAATISWTGVGTSFDIEYGPIGFTQGTGATSSSTTTSVSLTGLNSNSGYDVYVRNNCSSAGNGLSNWGGPLTFYTTCVEVSSYPWLENFEGTTWTASSGFSTTGDVIDQCWERNPTAYPPMAWLCHTGVTGSSSTGPASAYSGNNYMYTEQSSGTTGSFAYLQLPAFNMDSLTNPLFSYYYHRYGQTMGDLAVQVSVDTGATWTTVFTKQGEQQTSNAALWAEELIDLTVKSFKATIEICFWHLEY